MKMVMKGISHDDFPENGVGRWSYNYTSEEPMYCFGRFSNTFASELLECVGQLDIQVGSRICLNVCLLWSFSYALRWRVTHLG